MKAFWLNGVQVVIQWESNHLRIDLVQPEHPTATITFSGDDIDVIQRAADKIRRDRWKTAQEDS